jgi:hypothetical protein
LICPICCQTARLHSGYLKKRRHIPENGVAEGGLDIREASITHLPDDLSVGGMIFCD